MSWWPNRFLMVTKSTPSAANQVPKVCLRWWGEKCRNLDLFTVLVKRWRTLSGIKGLPSLVKRIWGAWICLGASFRTAYRNSLMGTTRSRLPLVMKSLSQRILITRCPKSTSCHVNEQTSLTRNPVFREIAGKCGANHCTRDTASTPGPWSNTAAPSRVYEWE